MSHEARQLLIAFESLSPEEQCEFALEVLRRAPVYGDLPEEALASAADELFSMYDGEEADASGPKP